MRALLLGARGAVGAVVRRELTETGHLVTAAGRLATDDAVIDLRGDLSALRALAADHDVVINATGVERTDLSAATRETPLVEVSATGAYLDRLRDRAAGPIVLGAGLAPGLSTILAVTVLGSPGDDVDVLVMLGAGERHGSAAVAWTVGLVGTDVHRPPEGGTVRNLRGRTRATGPDGRLRRYVRADFPDHLLLAGRAEPRIRSYLAMDSPAMTAALWLVGRLPALRRTLGMAPHFGTDGWHVIARNRQTGQERHVGGVGQSAATGRLVALAAIRAATASFEIANMADLVRLDEAVAALHRDAASATT